MSEDQNQVVDFFQSAQRFANRPGLERMQALLAELGNPQSDLRCLHVAGTNGKGSVCAFMASALAWADYKTGVYTSPFLERFSERIRILNGRAGLAAYQQNEAEGEISQADLVALSEIVKQATQRVVQKGIEHPTEFELITALAFLYFKQQNCQYIVLETGLGGRLDSTNIIEKPLCTVITAIHYDHMERLGSQIEEIAEEKAGIIKPGVPIYLLAPEIGGLSEKESAKVRAVITQVSQAQAAPLHVVEAKEWQNISFAQDKQVFSLQGFEQPFEIQLFGAYQMGNASLAARALEGIVDQETIRQGFSQTRWKGRLEILQKSPLVIIDGAHNLQGVMAFRQSIDQFFSEAFLTKSPRLLLGFLEDKDYEQILERLLRDLPFPLKEIICVKIDNPRTLKPQRLKSYIVDHFDLERLFYKEATPMYNIIDKIEAWDDAEEAAGVALERSMQDGSPLLCLGSLYLVGQLRSTLQYRQKEIN